MANTLTGTDLAEMFGIDIVTSDDTARDATGIMCGKCKGRGNFIGYTGRVVGKCFTCAGTGLARGAGMAPQPGEVAEAINVTGIATAFAAAKSNGVKTPKLRLGEFVFSRAPDSGRNTGAIYVKKSSGEYLGKVAAGGFRPTLDCDDATTAKVIAVAATPGASARAYGNRTGECSCCGRELTNHASIAIGIGPICAEKFGF